MLRCSLCTLEPTLTTARDRAMPTGGYRTHLWLVRVASAWTLAGRAFCSPKYVAALSTWGLAFLRLSHSFRSTKDSAGLPTCEKARSKYDSSHVMAILLSVTLWVSLKWPIWSSTQLKTVVTHCGWIGEYCDIWMESIHRLLCADVLWEIRVICCGTAVIFCQLQWCNSDSERARGRTRLWLLFFFFVLPTNIVNCTMFRGGTITQHIFTTQTWDTRLSVSLALTWRVGAFLYTLSRLGGSKNIWGHLIRFTWCCSFVVASTENVAGPSSRRPQYPGGRQQQCV